MYQDGFNIPEPILLNWALYLFFLLKKKKKHTRKSLSNTDDNCSVNLEMKVLR